MEVVEVDPAKSAEAFTWRLEPGKTQPFRTLVIFGFAILAAILGVLLGSTSLGLLGFAMIVMSTADFWLGTTYSLTSKGASSRTGMSTTFIEWELVRRVIASRQSIRLSPLAQDGPTSAFRGVVLKFDEPMRAEVIEKIQCLGGSHVSILE